MLTILQVDIHPFYAQPYHQPPYQYQDWLMESIFESDIYIQSKEPLEQGDLLTGIHRRLIGAHEHIDVDDHMLVVVAQFEGYYVAKVDSFAGDRFFDRYLPALIIEKGPEATYVDLFPFEAGNELLLIPREERRRWGQIKEVYNQLSRGEHVQSADIPLYEQMIKACDAFIDDFSKDDSFFVDDAYFQKGFALHKLKRFEASTRTFLQYLKLFPNETSVNGAHSWITENQLYIAANPQLKEKKTILFLAANPSDASRRRQGVEIREIEEELSRARLRDEFELVQRWALTPRDLQRVLQEYEPSIVHFTGEGRGEGLLFENNQGESQLVPADALADVFRILTDKIDCVIFNACFSSHQASLVAQHIPAVIGMKGQQTEDMGIHFSAGFYMALGSGKNYMQAFELGKNAIMLEGVTGENVPVWVKR